MVLPIGLPIKLPIELPIVARLDPAWFPPVSPGLAGQGRLGWGRGWALARWEAGWQAAGDGQATPWGLLSRCAIWGCSSIAARLLLGSGAAGGGRWPSDTVGVALTVCNLGLLQYC